MTNAIKFCRLTLFGSVCATLLIAGCSGRHISTSVQDQTLVPGQKAPAETAKTEPETPAPVSPPAVVAPAPQEPVPVQQEPGPPAAVSPSSAVAPISQEPIQAQQESGPPTQEQEPVQAPPVASSPASPVEKPVEHEAPQSEVVAESPPPPPVQSPSYSEPTPSAPPVLSKPAVESMASAPPTSPMKSADLGDVFFDYDQFTIRSEAQAVLEANANILKAGLGGILLIEGHCDERGTLAYNLVLGERRARAVKQYLQDLGVDASRMQITSYGKERPFCTEHSEDCWQQNRRAHLVVK